MFNCLCFLQGWQVWFVPSEAVPVSCPPSGFSPPHPLPAAAGCDVSGAFLRGRLQLHSLQQLCPILLPHAPLHQRTPTHMRTTTRVPFTNTSVEETERSPSLPVYSPVADPVALINLSPTTIKSCSWIWGLLHMEIDFFSEAIRNFSSRAFPHYVYLYF